SSQPAISTCGGGKSWGCTLEGSSGASGVVFGEGSSVQVHTPRAHAAAVASVRAIVGKRVRGGRLTAVGAAMVPRDISARQADERSGTRARPCRAGGRSRGDPAAGGALAAGRPRRG